MSTTANPADVGDQIDSATWRLDPARSSVEFHVRHFYGLMTVKGRFDSYHDTLDLDGRPAVELTIDADSLDTKHAKRDAHLRSGDFFDIANHPQVRFVADSASLRDETLTARGDCTSPAGGSRWLSKRPCAVRATRWRSRRRRWSIPASSA